MLKHWIVKEGADRVLLFFNGWAMDQGIVRALPLPCDTDLLCLYGYHRNDWDLSAELDCYSRIDVVAWSMGVWAAAHALKGRVNAIGHCVAVNGTGRPMDASTGINPDVIEATIRNFSESSRNKFMLRIAGGKTGFSRLEPFLSNRALDDQLEELIWWRENACIEGEPLPWNRVICGTADRVFPLASQLAYWEGYAPEHYPIPHYPFYSFNSWNKLLLPL